MNHTPVIMHHVVFPSCFVKFQTSYIIELIDICFHFPG